MLKFLNEVPFLTSDTTLKEFQSALQKTGFKFAGKVLDIYDADNKIKKARKVKNTMELLTAAETDLQGVITAFNKQATARALKVENVQDALPFVQILIDMLAGKVSDKVLKNASLAIGILKGTLK
jgi:hypothetical protein